MYFDQPLPATAALCDALTFHVFEIDGVDTINDDEVLDVKVTANRGHDCLSHRGIAKELSAILNIPLKADPLRQLPMLIPPTTEVSVQIKTPLSSRYIAGYIRGVKVGPSPEWLRKCLESMGQRSVNNIVDATNFVMFGVGQPLHAFDAAKLSAVDTKGRYSIEVRPARAGEKMLALDGKEYTLDESMLVIADAHADTAIGIAGVKGGAASGIDTDTKDIIIESANFDGVSIRKTAQRLKLRTDASSRFEQVMSSEVAAYGMRAVVDLILRLAEGELVGFVDVYPALVSNAPVSVSLDLINKTLGTTLSAADVVDAFKRLDLTFENVGEVFTVTAPSERLDILIQEDLIEEVGRIVGYDKVPATPLPALALTPAVNFNFYKAEKIRDYLTGLGFSEVLTSVFTEKGERVVLNKVDGVRPYLRQDVQAGLADALARNIHIKDLLGVKQIKIFEIGTVWTGGAEVMTYDIAVEKVKGEKTQDEYRKELDIFVASLPTNPTQYDVLPLSTTDRYESFSKYPFIVRDIALWVPAGTEADVVLEVLRKEAGTLLVRSRIFDRFEKDGKVSLAFRLVFQSFERTLTDEEINTQMAAVQVAVEARGWQVR